MIVKKEVELSNALKAAFPKAEVVVTRDGPRRFSGSVTSKKFSKMKPETAASKVNAIVSTICKKCTASIKALAPATPATV